MNIYKITIFSAALFFTICSWPVSANGKKPGGGGVDYDVVVLAPPGAQINGSYANDVDDFGNVVGCYVDASAQCHGFYYNLAQNSYLVFGAGVEIRGINNLGEMVGVDTNTGEGLYWRSADDQNPVALTSLAGDHTSDAVKINDEGIIIGSSSGGGFPRAVAWKVQQSGAVSIPVALPFAEGDVRGSAVDLSESNGGVARVAGYSGTLETFPSTAIEWQFAVVADDLVLISGPTDLGSLDGGPSAAYGVNKSGVAVGESNAWPFAQPSGQGMQPLPGLRKATWGRAEGINQLGKIVGAMGYLLKGKPVQKAVLWSDASEVIDLNGKVDLGRSEALESAFRINNSGDILASGFFPSVTELGDVACLLIKRP